MLASLTVRDIVLIERAELSFRRGLNVLTGETGAGKSILLTALGLALGDRADSGFIRPGAARMLAWGVPDGTRDAETGGYLHDDLVISAALCAKLDGLPWHVPTGPGVILPAADPLEELSKGF